MSVGTITNIAGIATLAVAAVVLGGLVVSTVFTLFLEIDEPLETFGNISRGHFFYTPSKRGLGGAVWTIAAASAPRTESASGSSS